MEFFSKKTNFDFMGKRRLAIILSSVLILASIASLVVRGLNFGIDFTGGTLIEVGYPDPADLGALRDDDVHAFVSSQARLLGRLDLCDDEGAMVVDTRDDLPREARRNGDRARARRKRDVETLGMKPEPWPGEVDDEPRIGQRVITTKFVA